MNEIHPAKPSSKDGYTKDELQELRKMKQAFKHARIFMSEIENAIRNMGFKHTMQEIDRAVDLQIKNKSSVEVMLSFFAGITVGGFQAAHRFMFPSLPDSLEIKPNEHTKSKK